MHDDRSPLISPEDKGATIIEFALALPILALAMFGVIQFGLLYTARLALETACSEAARYSVLSPRPLPSDVQNYARALVAARLDSSAERLDPPVVTDLPANQAGGVLGARKVELSYHYPNFFQGIVPGVGPTFQIRTNVIAR